MNNQDYTERMFHKVGLRFRMIELRLAFLTREITPVEYREKIDAVIAEIKAVPELGAAATVEGKAEGLSK